MTAADRSAAAERERSLERSAEAHAFVSRHRWVPTGFVVAMLVGELASGAVSVALTTIVLITALFLLLHLFRPNR